MSISLQHGKIGDVDEVAPEVRAKEEKEMDDQRILEMRKKEKRQRKKQRGRSKIGNKMTSGTRQFHETMREGNKLAYLKEVQRAKEEAQTMDADQEFFAKHDSKFDAAEGADTFNNKKQKNQ